MVEPYMAIALQTRMWDDWRKNLDHIRKVMGTAIGLTSLEYPVKLVALAEGAIQGFGATGPGPLPVVEIPGEQTDIIGEMAKTFNVYIIAELFCVKELEFEDRLFNAAFIVNPKGQIIYKRYKMQHEYMAESWTTSPHDVWDAWVQKKGATLDSLYSVAETDIGKIGCMICMEGGYPEISRGLALNGAEVIYRATYHEPFVGDGTWELQNRAHALFNTCYVIAPNNGVYEGKAMSEKGPFDITGGNSMIVDFKGKIIHKVSAGTDTYAAGLIDIEALRRHRTSVMGIGNFLKDLRTEAYKIIYQQPIYPKNTRLTGPAPPDRWLANQKEAYKKSVDTLLNRRIYIKPSEKE